MSHRLVLTGSRRWRPRGRGASRWRSRAGPRVQFGGYVGGFGRADPLEDRQCLPQLVFGLGGAAGGRGAPAQAGQRVRFLQRDAELAGQVQGLLVACPGLAEVTAGPAQRPGLVQSRDFSVRAGDLTGDVQRLLQVPGRARIVPGRQQR
jgi:hypothetical protein